MDIDDIFYIVVAIIIAIVNGIAQKKKKSNQRARAAQAPVANQEQEEPDDVALDPLQILFGGAIPPQQPTQSAERYTFTDQEKEEPEAERYEYAYHAPEQAESIEYQAPHVAVKEEELYQQKTYQPIDIVAQPNQFPLDVVPDSEEQSLDIELSDITEGEIKGIDEEEAEARLLGANRLLDGFDAEKAIVYAEIMLPKYF